MKRSGNFLLPLAAMIMFTSSALAQNKPNAGFEKLKSLAGEWSGKKTDGKMVTVIYQVISGGNSVMETIVPEGEPNMVSVYHPDGNKVMMTHYCSLGS